MPAARSQGLKGSPTSKDGAETVQNGTDGLSANGQERTKQRKSVKRAAESNNQAVANETGKEVKKSSGRPTKRSKGQVSEPMQTKPGEPEPDPERPGATPGITPPSPEEPKRAKAPRKRSGQKAKRRSGKTLLMNGLKTRNSPVALVLVEPPVKPSKRKVAKNGQENGRHSKQKVSSFKEHGIKILRSHVIKPATASNRSSTTKGAQPRPPPQESGDEGEEGGARQWKRRRRARKKSVETQVDDKLRLKRRVKNLVNRIRLEQNLIDAYAGEGWKGQSREKIRPEKELQRAESQIFRCKLQIRENIHELDNLGLEGSLQESAFDEEGRIFHEEIFCAKCKSQEAFLDNDIILCDGACDRGFHQECLDPPLATVDIPPGDEGWLCPVCDSKVECLNYINSYLGTEFQVEDQWEDLFAEVAAQAAGGGTTDAMGEDWPSEDSEDDDYDPERPKVVKDGNEEEHNKGDSLDSLSDAESEPEATSGSGSSSDDDSQTSGVSGDELEQRSTRSQRKERGIGSAFVNGNMDPDPLTSTLLAEDKEEVVPVSGKRHRKPVDYKKLHDEMFGKGDIDDGVHSEDEEWGPGRGRRRGKFEVVNAVDKSDCNGAASGTEPRRRNRRKSSGAEKPASIRSSDDGKSHRRLPDSAVEMLRKEFEMGMCFPSRLCKEALAQKLGITFQQISSWFKNARHAAKIGTGQSPQLPRKRTPPSNGSSTGTEDGMDEMEVTNGLLVEKLDEVQMKLHHLKRTLEAIVANPDTEQGTKYNGRLGEGGIFDNSVVLTQSNGKRILYVPVAEVVEKDLENGS